MAGAGLYVQFCAEPLCKLVGCFRRHEDIRVRADHCPYAYIVRDALRVDICTEVIVQHRQ